MRKLLLVLFLIQAACNGGSDSSFSGESKTLLKWNQITIDASGRDHQANGAKEQLGPTRAARAVAIVHLAMYDTVSSIKGGYHTYLPHSPAPSEIDLSAAIAKSAHTALSAVFPSQKNIFDNFLNEELQEIPDSPAEDAALIYAAEIATDIITARTNDGSELNTLASELNYPFNPAPGYWAIDPISKKPPAVGWHWHLVKPFVIESAEQFRAPPPPALNSNEYAEAYAEVYRLGGDGIITPTERTEEQTQIGIFWAYDGTPTLCAPTRLYNQVVRQITEQHGPGDVLELARLFALLNLALADAGSASWESKYFYDYWRPVTAIRESDPGTGPSGLGDGNDLTPGDVNFTPLGAPASNLSGPNFTPPFPAYPSGHAVYGGALFEILRNYYGTDNLPFTFISDEFNGITTDNQGNVRPYLEKRYDKLSEAETENGVSRIYLGIHWNFDITHGITQGQQVADYIYDNSLQPLN